MAVIIKFASFFLLFVSASCSPTGHRHHGACTDVQKSALEFNAIAKKAVSNIPKDIRPFSTSLAWMEAQDQCDPGTLRLAPESCIKKMLDVLTSYESFVKTEVDLKGCAGAREVQPVLNKLHNHMSRCVKSRTEYHHHKVDHTHEKLEDWQRPLLCNYTIERLFSFSILTARVFSVGDPANHAEPTERADSPNCAQKNV
ncbi:hypothetical protein NL108_006452 [Boleophthalmus pectinirostris]|nr:hypothetical protein NL108_006452 [Boleophthalmus pectinirostris]